MPHYVASGSHFYNGEKYRFLIIPRYKKDLEEVLKLKKMLSLKTVLTISLQILDILEYIHSKGYIHSDIKASNIMLGNGTESAWNSTESPNRIEKRSLRITRTQNRLKLRQRVFSKHTLRPIGSFKYVDDIPYLDDMLKNHEENSVIPKKSSVYNNNLTESDHAYLLDYGLASKFLLANGSHKPFCTDERKAHAGTVLFCSRDAHKGVPTRRSDLESLGYNIIFWLTGELPWIEDLTEPEEIENKKNRCFRQLNSFLQFCFHNVYPAFLLDYFSYLSKLQFQVSNIFTMTIKMFPICIFLFQNICSS